MQSTIVGAVPALVALVISPKSAEATMEKLENPVTVEYLQANLRKEHPRLGMTPDLEADSLSA